MSEWEVVALGDVAETRNGAGIKQDHFSESGVPLARVSDFTDYSIDLSECIHVEPEHAKQWERHILKEGDVVVATVGSWPPNWASVVGKAVRVPRSAAGSIQNQNTCCVIARSGSADQRFLFYLLRSKEFALYAANAAGGSANQARLPVANLKAFEFAQPPLKEQKRVAHILGTLDDKIELNRRMNRTLEAIARAIFKSWFIDFDPVYAKAEGGEPVGMDPETAALFPASFQDSPLGKIPKGWDVGGVRGFAEVRYGAAYSSKHFNDEGDGLPLLRIRDLKTHSPQVYTTEEHSKGEVVSLGDIVVGMDGEFRAHIWTGPDSWLNQRVCKLSPIQQGLHGFVYLAVKRPLAECERAKTGTTVIHLSKSDIDSFQLIHPPRVILKAYSHVSEPILSLGTRLASSSADLASVRDMLLPRLLSGQLQADAVGNT